MAACAAPGHPAGVPTVHNVCVGTRAARPPQKPTLEKGVSLFWQRGHGGGEFVQYIIEIGVLFALLIHHQDDAPRQPGERAERPKRLF